MNSNIFKDRLHQIRDLIEVNELDAVIIYNSHTNYRYGLWLNGTVPELANYLVITKGDAYLLELEYLVDSVRNELNLEVLKCDEEFEYKSRLRNILKDNIRIGITTLVPFIDIQNIKAEFVDISAQLDLFLLVKSEDEISYLKDLQSFTLNVLDRLVDVIMPGINELEIESFIKKEFANYADELAFPISVTSGKRLNSTTCAKPIDRIINRSDIVCVDIGLIKNGYYSDSTRCYALNDDHLRIYMKLSQLHQNLILMIKAGMSSKQVKELYILEIKKNFGEVYFVEEFIGHSLGFGLHENPIIGNSNFDDWFIPENSVINLEPEIMINKVRFRIEDTVFL